MKIQGKIRVEFFFPFINLSFFFPLLSNWASALIFSQCSANLHWWKVHLPIIWKYAPLPSMICSAELKNQNLSPTRWEFWKIWKVLKTPIKMQISTLWLTLRRDANKINLESSWFSCHRPTFMNFLNGNFNSSKFNFLSFCWMDSDKSFLIPKIDPVIVLMTFVFVSFSPRKVS